MCHGQKALLAVEAGPCLTGSVSDTLTSAQWNQELSLFAMG